MHACVLLFTEKRRNPIIAANGAKKHSTDQVLYCRYCTSCAPSNTVLKDLGLGVSLAACQAACEANPQCRYINIALPPENQACELFATCGSPSHNPGCTGQDWWTTYRKDVRDAALWPATTEGFTGKVKTFWFGANESGLDSEETLALIAKHTVGGYVLRYGSLCKHSELAQGFQAAFLHNSTTCASCVVIVDLKQGNNFRICWLSDSFIQNRLSFA